MPRRRLLETLGMRSANLSNVLTQLLAHSLIDRRDKGKEAEFRLTRLGRQMIESEEASAPKSVPQPLSLDVDRLAKLLSTGVLCTELLNSPLKPVSLFAHMALPRGLHGTLSFDELMQDHSTIFHTSAHAHHGVDRAASPTLIDYHHRRGRASAVLLPAP